MVVNLSDAQIARVFELAGKIVKIQGEIPLPPGGGATMAETAKLETAKALRASLERSNDTLLELGALLR